MLYMLHACIHRTDIHKYVRTYVHTYIRTYVQFEDSSLWSRQNRDLKSKLRSFGLWHRVAM